MRESIDYRMNQIMGTATRYKNEWGLDIQDCRFFDKDSYINKGLQNYANMFSLVCKYPLFDEPAELQGRPYVKGKKYITACILEAGWNPDQAADKLDGLVKYKNQQGRPLHYTSYYIYQDIKTNSHYRSRSSKLRRYKS